MKEIIERDFSSEDFSNRNGSGAIYVHCIFDRADLSHSSFTNCWFVNCTFRRTFFAYANIESSCFVWVEDVDGCVAYVSANISEDIPSVKIDSVFLNQLSGTAYAPEYGRVLSELDCEDSHFLTNFSNCNAANCQFIGNFQKDKYLKFVNSTFSNADLSGAHFSSCILDHSTFDGANFLSSSVENAMDKGEVECSERGDKVGVTTFDAGSSLIFCDFRAANLRGVNFDGCKTLEASDFTRADLEGAVFCGPAASLESDNDKKRTSLARTVFDYSTLSEVIFESCDLDATSFDVAYLERVKLYDPKRREDPSSDELSTRAKAASFVGAYLSGFAVNPEYKQDLKACDFSSAFFGRSDENDGAVLSGAILDGSLFTGAILAGVDFDNASLKEARFQNAMFHVGDGGGDPGKKTFLNVDLYAADFSNVDLSGYKIIECRLEKANFNYSRLVDVEMHWESSDIAKKAKNASFVGAEMDGARINYGGRYRVDLSRSDFSMASLKGVKIQKCDLHYCRFIEAVCDGVNIRNSALSFSAFLRTRGEQVTIEFLGGDRADEPAGGIEFRQHYLIGEFFGRLVGAIIEHGEFALHKNSDLRFEVGIQSSGAVFVLLDNSALLIDLSRLENSGLTITDNARLIFKNSTMISSAVMGLNRNCQVKEVTFDSCTIYESWWDSKIESIKATLTSIKRKPDDTEYRHLDAKSLAALQANARSQGDDGDEEKYFKEQFKEQYLSGGQSDDSFFYILLLFLLGIYFGMLWVPGISDNNVQYRCQTTSFASGISALLLVYARIRPVYFRLLGAGENALKPILASFGVIIVFAASFFPLVCVDNKLVGTESFVERFLQSFHLSANAFFALGYWGKLKWQPDILIFRIYINVESAIGIIMSAVIVATIIRKTMSR